MSLHRVYLRTWLWYSLLLHLRHVTLRKVHKQKDDIFILFWLDKWHFFLFWNLLQTPNKHPSDVYSVCSYDSLTCFTWLTKNSGCCYSNRTWRVVMATKVWSQGNHLHQPVWHHALFLREQFRVTIVPGILRILNASREQHRQVTV